MLRPNIVVVPNAVIPLVGLCHVRSEFLPVLNLSPLLGEHHATLTGEPQMLVLASREGNWGLLVDQVVALTSLETSVAPEGRSDSWFAAVLGWATYRDEVVRVMEPSVYYRLAETAFEECWLGRRGIQASGFGRGERNSSTVLDSSHTAPQGDLSVSAV